MQGSNPLGIYCLHSCTLGCLLGLCQNKMHSVLQWCERPRLALLFHRFFFFYKIAGLKTQRKLFYWINRKMPGCPMHNNFVDVCIFYLKALNFLLYWMSNSSFFPIWCRSLSYLVESTWCTNLICNCTQNWDLECFQGSWLWSQLTCHF